PPRGQPPLESTDPTDPLRKPDHRRGPPPPGRGPPPPAAHHARRGVFRQRNERRRLRRRRASAAGIASGVPAGRSPGLRLFAEPRNQRDAPGPLWLASRAPILEQRLAPGQAPRSRVAPYNTGRPFCDRTPSSEGERHMTSPLRSLIATGTKLWL